MWGRGLVSGLAVTLRHHFEKKITRQYPEERPELPPRSRGNLDYDIHRCIACGICTQVCPNGVLTLESIRASGGKKKAKQMIIELQYCLFCALCVENCPASCLYFTPKFELACFNRADSRRVYSIDSEPELDTKLTVESGKNHNTEETSLQSEVNKAEILSKKQRDFEKAGKPNVSPQERGKRSVYS